MSQDISQLFCVMLWQGLPVQGCRFSCEDGEHLAKNASGGPMPTNRSIVARASTFRREALILSFGTRAHTHTHRALIHWAGLVIEPEAGHSVRVSSVGGRDPMT